MLAALIGFLGPVSLVGCAIVVGTAIGCMLILRMTHPEAGSALRDVFSPHLGGVLHHLIPPRHQHPLCTPRRFQAGRLKRSR
ncbi:HPP family protein [Rhizobium grahamii]|uniref:HPP family protein n=1 Tax=Rhizobium grahamii TaxID=1120045 RepID=A0A5Q0CDB9_9HYPH|nr:MULTISPECIES: HPP family protein [Rhizobium]QFY62120.1 HPP family protein [Rhizobium grahamii]QRM48697.1 HPP family protein [Rhizobium sp. BG6]